MAELFEQPYPARVAIGVKELPKGAEIEMDGIVVT
jgi:enamine deaminase RidA (YjgF/YER057c/UK114 family)